jgi:hypothetical protein
MMGAKSVAIKTLGYEKMCVTVMLAVLTHGSKLPLTVCDSKLQNYA